MVSGSSVQVPRCGAAVCADSLVSHRLHLRPLGVPKLRLQTADPSDMIGTVRDSSRLTAIDAARKFASTWVILVRGPSRIMSRRCTRTSARYAARSRNHQCWHHRKLQALGLQVAHPRFGCAAGDAAQAVAGVLVTRSHRRCVG